MSSLTRTNGVASVFAGIKCDACGWHLRAASQGRCPICEKVVGQARRLVAALLPPSWASRDEALRAAAEIDRRHGAEALAVLLDAWLRMRDAGHLPADRWTCDLLLELQVLLAGGCEPRLRLGREVVRAVRGQP